MVHSLLRRQWSATSNPSRASLSEWYQLARSWQQSQRFDWVAWWSTLLQGRGEVCSYVWLPCINT